VFRSEKIWRAPLGIEAAQPDVASGISATYIMVCLEFILNPSNRVTWLMRKQLMRSN